ncbi:MAG TPA: hypothetical protein VKY92_07220 [Verrucomicrobiae bacterium]|nr:hypothetical protein [Verrucomicrobiae bacterium]
MPHIFQISTGALLRVSRWDWCFRWKTPDSSELAFVNVDAPTGHVEPETKAQRS